MIYYVDANAKRTGDGSKEKPFKKIGEAAALAMPGDEVVVRPGIYREDVDPLNAGKAKSRIVYRSERRREAVISGADVFDNWEHYEKDV